MINPPVKLFPSGSVFCLDCCDFMVNIPDDSIDLTVTSPPYDRIRDYSNGNHFNFDRLSSELVRVTKDGGSIVWVVGDSTTDGGESLTSFRHALRFQSLGLNIETMIYEKSGTGAAGSNNLYRQSFEYMFAMFKGKPKSVNLIRDCRNKAAGHAVTMGRLNLRGDNKDFNRRIVTEFSKRSNIWRYSSDKDTSRPHPAKFPLQLVIDHIISWSEPGDIICDPLVGSGTTAIAAIRTNRSFVINDKSEQYIVTAIAAIKREISFSNSKAKVGVKSA